MNALSAVNGISQVKNKINISWKEIHNAKKKSAPPEDSLELRISFFENVMTDEWGDPIKQHDLHNEIQRYLYECEQDGQHETISSAPFGSGKSQQLPIGLGVYFNTLVPEETNGIITADPKLSKKRIIAIRRLVIKPEYKRWCKENNLTPLEFDKSLDNESSEEIYFKSKNDTGNPSFFAAGIETGGTGYRFWRLWGDDICDMKDFNSEATRERRYNAWTTTWTSRVYDGGFVYLIRTPYHPQDANERLIKSGAYNHLEIAVREDKTGYDVKEWRVDKGLVKSDVIPLWERNHSVEKLNKAERENYAAYALGYRMQKEVQNPELSTYLNFSKELYPEGNVTNVEFDWMKPLCMMCDFNRGTMAWALGQKQNIDGEEKYVVLWDMTGENVTTKQHARTVGEWILKEGHDFVELYGDATANQGGKKGYGRWGTNDWKDVTDVFDEIGLSYRKKVGKSNPKRNERVRIVRNLIYTESNGLSIRSFLIHERCDKIIDDYAYSIRDGDELKKVKQGSRGHISDACDYWAVKDKKGHRNVTFIK